MVIRRVEIVNHQGLAIEENLDRNTRADFVCVSLVKYSQIGIFNHIQSFITSRFARQLYFTFIDSRVSYGIKVYGHCADKYLNELQTKQNKLMLKLDRRTSTNQLHRNPSLLKVSDIHIVYCVLWITAEPPDVQRLFYN